MKLWIDDIRPAPKDYLWCKSVNEAKECVEYFEELIEELRSQHIMRRGRTTESTKFKTRSNKQRLLSSTLTMMPGTMQTTAVITSDSLIGLKKRDAITLFVFIV